MGWDGKGRGGGKYREKRRMLSLEEMVVDAIGRGSKSKIFSDHAIWYQRGSNKERYFRREMERRGGRKKWRREDMKID